MSISEVAQLRRLIDLECEAMRQALTGYAVTAKHEIITARYNQLGEHFEKLAEIIGDFEAVEVIAEILERTLR